jgi:hypothetical protein
VAKWLISGEFQWILDDGVTTTRCRATRRPWVFDPRRRLLPDAGEGGDWRSSGRAVRRVGPSQVVREVRQVRAKRIEVRGGARAHCRRRNRPEMLAVLRTIGEEFVGLGWVFVRKEKRKRGRRPWGIYGRPIACSRG